MATREATVPPRVAPIATRALNWASMAGGKFMKPNVAATPNPTPRHPNAFPILAVDCLANPAKLIMHAIDDARYAMFVN